MFHVTYQSNYNGCDIDGDDTDIGPDEINEWLTKVERCSDKIVEFAYEDFDEDEGYMGDIELLEEFATKTIHEAFGDVKVTFEEDSFST